MIEDQKWLMTSADSESFTTNIGNSKSFFNNNNNNDYPNNNMVQHSVN